MYKYYLCEVPQLDEILEGINEKNAEIISVFFTSDTAQVCIITKEKKESPLRQLFDERFRMDRYEED